MVGWVEISFPFAQQVVVVCVVFWLALAVALYLGKSRVVIGKLYRWSSVVTGLRGSLREKSEGVAMFNHSCR